MKRLCDRVEILDVRDLGDAKYEVCATVVATYNDDRGELSVTLDSFLRKVNRRGVMLELRPDWLPAPDTIKHPLTFEEAIEELGEIAKSWTRKVKESIPGEAESHQFSISRAE